MPISSSRPLAYSRAISPQHPVVEVARDQLEERRRVAERVLVNGAQEEAGLEDVLLVDGRVDVPEDVVVGGAEKGARRDERTGADAGDELEVGPVAPLGPADEQPGAEGAVVAVPRDREEVRRRQRVGLGRWAELRPLASERGARLLYQLLHLGIGEIARIGDAAEHRRPLGQRHRNGRVPERHRVRAERRPDKERGDAMARGNQPPPDLNRPRRDQGLAHACHLRHTPAVPSSSACPAVTVANRRIIRGKMQDAAALDPPRATEPHASRATTTTERRCPGRTPCVYPS